MTEETLRIGREQLVTRTCADPSSGTALTYVLRGGFLVATVEASGEGSRLYGAPERYGIDRQALATALEVGT
jgi:hypothetical protein